MRKSIAVITAALALQFALAQQTEPVTLTPDMDWLDIADAFQAGGDYLLEPGEYEIFGAVEVNSNLSVTGMGEPGDTVIRFDSDGGQYSEQFAIVGLSGDQTLRVSLDNLTIEHGGSYVSDLVTAFGNVLLEVDHVRFAHAYDDLFAYDDPDTQGLHWGTGIYASYGPRVIVTDSEFDSNIMGIEVREVERLIVSDSSFTDNRLAGVMAVHSPVTVTSSRFSGGETGIGIHGDYEGVLIGNELNY